MLKMNKVNGESLSLRVNQSSNLASQHPILADHVWLFCDITNHVTNNCHTDPITHFYMLILVVVVYIFYCLLNVSDLKTDALQGLFLFFSKIRLCMDKRRNAMLYFPPYCIDFLCSHSTQPSWPQQLPVCLQTVGNRFWKWLLPWTFLGSGGNGEPEMISPSPLQKPHHCFLQRRTGRATAQQSSEWCTPTTVCVTRTGRRFPGGTQATASVQPSTLFSPSCPRISLNSFIGMQLGPPTIHTLA